MTLKEYLKSLKDRYININNILNNRKEGNYSDVSELAKERAEEINYKKEKNAALAIILNNIKSEEDLDKFINLSSGKLKEKLLKDKEFAMHVNYKSEIRNYENENHIDETNMAKMTSTELKNLYNQYGLKSDNLEDSILKTFIGRVDFPTDEKEFDDFNNLLNEFTKDNEKEVMNSIENIKVGKFEPKIVKENEINELINNTTDPELKEAYRYIKDNIFTLRSEEEVNYDQFIAEGTVEYIEDSLGRKVINEIKNDETFKDITYVNGNTSITANTTEKELLDEADNKIKESGIVLNDETKKILKESLEYLDNFKDALDESKPMFDINTFLPEEGVKVYAFKNLNNLYGKAYDLIPGGSKDDILKTVKAHKENIIKYNELKNIVNKFDTKAYPGNVQIARNTLLPKYVTEDFKNTSLINGLWQSLGLIKATGSTIDEFIENPTKVMFKVFDKYKNFKLVNEFGKEGDVAFLKNISNTLLNRERSDEASRKTNFGRAIEFVSLLDKDNYVNNFKTNLFIDGFKISPFYGNNAVIMTSYLGGQRNSLETIRNILVTKETKDKNYANLTVNHIGKLDPASNETIHAFDFNRYIKSDECDIDYLCEKFKKVNTELEKPEFDEEHLSKIKDMCYEAMENITLNVLVHKKGSIKNPHFFELIDNNTDKDYKYMLEKYSKVNKVAINDTVKECFDSLTNNNNQSTNKEENLVNSAYLIKYLNNEYNSSNIFKRIFYKEVKAKKSMADTMTKKLVEKGVDESLLKSYLEGKIDKDLLRSELKVNKEINNFNTKTKFPLKEDPTAPKTNEKTEIIIENNKDLDKNKDIIIEKK